ncbi:hypothetical protein AB1N83_005560 [Pleurotus pulmonarius]
MTTASQADVMMLNIRSACERWYCRSNATTYCQVACQIGIRTVSRSQKCQNKPVWKAYPCHAPHSHGCASVAATLSQRPSLLPSTHDYVRSNTFQARLYRKESQPWFGTPYHLA